MPVAATQRELFAATRALPNGFRLREEFLSPGEESSLLAAIRELPLVTARYRAFTAKRRIVSFGAGYDFETNALLTAPPLPAFLHLLRDRVAAWAGFAAAALAQCTVAEYTAGTQLGWHRDLPRFGTVAGISLASACRMRLRRYPHVQGSRERALILVLQPRSAYVLADDARWHWQHAITPTKALRYSITFRTIRGTARP